MNVPAELKYTKTHEWVSSKGDTATVGITDYAQSELGDIVYVELPNVGRVVQAGETIGSVESVKTVSDVYAPVSGEVVEVNGALGAQSELMNTNPFDKGFLVKIKLSDPGELEGLLDAKAYTGVSGH